MMRGLSRLALLATACLTVGTVQGTVSHDSGTCMVYPADGWCANYGLDGELVFVWNNTSLETLESELRSKMTIFEQATSSSTEEDCLNEFFRMSCLGTFALCDSNTYPRRPCQSYCESTTETCAKLIEQAVRFGVMTKVFECTDTIGDAFPDTSRSDGHGVFYHYLESWNGEPIFPSDATYTDPAGAQTTCVSDNEGSATCVEKTCGWGSTLMRYPIETDSMSGLIDFVTPGDLDYCIESGIVGSASYNATLDCSRCVTTCDIRCPLPFVYSDGEYKMMWILTWLPGALAFPLAILVVASETKRVRQLKRRDITDSVVACSAVICILLFFLDSLPSAILAEDLRCNGYDTINFRTNTYAHDFCEVGKIKPHLLQALLVCVAITLYKVLRQLKASQQLSRYVPSRSFRVLVPVLIVGFPGMLSIGTFVLEADQLYMSSPLYREAQGGSFSEKMMYYPNLIRYAYSCGPLFETEENEYIFVQGPLLMVGLICVLLSFALLKTVAKMSGIRFSYTATAAASSTSKSATKKKSSGPSATLYKLAVNMLRFAAISTLLACINAASTFLFLPRALDFGKEVDTWFRCARTGIREDGSIWSTNSTELTFEVLTQDDLCGSLVAPSFWLIVLQIISQSLPPLFFGFIFALPALKQLRPPAAITSRVMPGGGTSIQRTVASSAADGSSAGPDAGK